METQTEDMQERRPVQVSQSRSHFYDGRWQAPASGNTIAVHNPATEEPIGEVSAGTAADVDNAVKAAALALESWRFMPQEERAALLDAVADALEKRQDTVAATICAEVGMPLKLSRMIQAGLPIQTFRNTARLLREFAFEEEVNGSKVWLEPVGVVAAITPWNYPLHQIAAKVAPALAVGCTVVLKPSELAPLNASILAEVFAEVGAPAGVFNVVHGTGLEAGSALAGHPLVDMISFTGSTATGKALARGAADGLKRLSLELGGKSASVVLESGDLEAAVKTTVTSCFLNSGQTCSALTRLIVPRASLSQAEELAKAAAEKFPVGNPMDPATKLGPLISSAQLARVSRLVAEALGQGAKCVTGGVEPPETPGTGYFFRPTVLSVHPHFRIAQEEVFGPVLCILAAENDGHAIEIANGTPYGLSAAVWSRDPEKALTAVRRLRSGQVHINGEKFNPLAPFGGVKESGYGRELGLYGMHEFLEPKAVTISA